MLRLRGPRAADGSAGMLAAKRLARHQAEDDDGDDRTDHGHDDAVDVDALDVAAVEEDAGEPATDDGADDPEDDHHQQALAGLHHLTRDEPVDRAEHDPA